MTAILGISAFYHDSAAALLVDGHVVAAAQEERFSRKKHDADFPRRAIAYCLREAGLDVEQLDHVGFYEKPLLKFERLLETYLAYAPAGYRSFLASVPDWMKRKLYLSREIRAELAGYRRRVVYTEHHEAHAASAFFPSPFDEAAILTADGVGEWATATIGMGRGNHIRLDQELRFPHSPGLLYSAFTHYCGFRVNSGEYKLMGLAPFGQPCYEDLIRDRLLDLKPDGSFRLDMRYFNYCQGRTMTSSRFHRLFGGPPREPESEITQRDMDLAASIQRVVEEIVLRMARHAHGRTGQSCLCLAGGVALNCVATGRLLREGPFERIWAQPAAGDAGGALGVAWFIWHQLLDRSRQPTDQDRQQASLLGPQYSEAQIEQFLRNRQAVFHKSASDEQLCRDVAQMIAGQNVVGWFQGRMEFGPRALGGRSILGDARDDEMQSRMNRKIKFRESFRPFAPSVLRNRVAEYFDVPANWDSPYMLVVAPVAASQRVSEGPGESSDEGPAAGLEKLKTRRSVIPAVTHVDGSARVQTVDARHGRFTRLIECFAELTGTPLVINTSFNVRGEPIVCSPEDAYRCFMATDMDVLVLEKYVLWKREQPQGEVEAADDPPAQAPLS